MHANSVLLCPFCVEGAAFELKTAFSGTYPSRIFFVQTQKL